MDVGVFTLVARLAPERVLARVFGLLESVGALAVGAGSVRPPAWRSLDEPARGAWL